MARTTNKLTESGHSVNDHSLVDTVQDCSTSVSETCDSEDFAPMNVMSALESQCKDSEWVDWVQQAHDWQLPFISTSPIEGNEEVVGNIQSVSDNLSFGEVPDYFVFDREPAETDHFTDPDQSNLDSDQLPEFLQDLDLTQEDFEDETRIGDLKLWSTEVWDECQGDHPDPLGEIFNQDEFRSEEPNLLDALYQQNVQNSEQQSKSNWSIFSTRPLYVQDHFYNTVEYTSIPSKCTTSKSPKKVHFNADNSNTPFDFYSGVQGIITTSFDPETCISSTYLGSKSDVPVSEVSPQDGSWFPTAEILVDKHSSTTATLPNGNSMKTLLDSGATKTMISKRIFDQNPDIFQHCPKYHTNTKIFLADSSSIDVDTCVKFTCDLSGHLFEFIAYIVKMSASYDLVMGAKDLIELETSLKLNHGVCQFKQRSLNLYPVLSEPYYLQPGSEISSDMHSYQQVHLNSHQAKELPN